MTAHAPTADLPLAEMNMVQNRRSTPGWARRRQPPRVAIEILNVFLLNIHERAAPLDPRSMYRLVNRLLGYS